MIQEVSRLHPDDPHGHLQELRTDPIALLHRVREECGDVGRFRLVDRDVVLVSGAEANEPFFRAPDEVLDQAEAYPFMTPIFGEGVVFDASPERRREALHNQALRDKFMRGHAQTIAAEVAQAILTMISVPKGTHLTLVEVQPEAPVLTDRKVDLR